MRVLQGVTGQAGQPWALAQGLRQIGIHAESCTIVEHKFGYQYHRMCDMRGVEDLSEAYRRLSPLIEEFDVFHFHARPFLIEWPNIPYPSFLDLLLLRLHEKKVFFHFRGQEIRLAGEFARVNPFHYANEVSGDIFVRQPDESKILFREYLRSICDGLFVVDPELQTYVPGSTVIPRVLDGQKWPNVGIGDNDTPVVVHAPSRRGFKGTPNILEAVSALKAEGLSFEFRLVENMSHAEAVGCYRQADIIIDQLRIGWYGVLAVEALALGKPAIAYIRDDLWQQHEGTLPLLNANPHTIKEVLRRAISDRGLRKRLAAEARTYFDEVHSSVNVARRLVDIYSAEGKSRKLDGFVALLDHQTGLFDGGVRSSKRTALDRLRTLRELRRSEGNIAVWRAVWNRLKREMGGRFG